LDTLLPRLSVGIFLVLCVIFTLVWRLIYIRIFTSHTFMRRIFIVGGGRSGQALLQVIKSIHPPPFVVVGIIDDDPDKQGSTIEDLPVMGTCERLLGLINQHNITDLAISGKMFDKTFQTLLEAQEKGVIITRMPVAYEELVGRVPIQLLEADWIMSYFVDKAKVSGFNDVFKRLLDIIGGLIGSIIFLLFLPIIGLAILIDDGWPIFYFQTRTGRGGRLYRITKFRTMRRDAEADGTPKWAKEDDERATRTGRILRKTHLDELPQFINVLTGDMSLVGPRAERPELVDFFQKQVPFYRTRLLVRPGMTGWAQVNFGYAATIEETTIKLEYDIYYILHRNILMDLVIILRTPSTVFGFRGR
jgi:exopolysaccharide biosynthesis polyprenyl glycosylphosphotransferase